MFMAFPSRWLGYKRVEISVVLGCVFNLMIVLEGDICRPDQD